MRKNFLSAMLALALCLGLALPAYAASDLTGNQLYPAGDWGNGPSLTLKGVVAETDLEMEGTRCYDVAVGGSLTLDMPFPAGENRNYVVMVAPMLISPDWTTYCDEDVGEDWVIPEEYEGDVFDGSSGKGQYVYPFTEADMGQIAGYNKVISMHLYWDKSADPNADYPDDYGAVYFYFRVIPADSSSPAQSAAVTANPTSASVLVNGTKTDFDAYSIEGNNYFKLRDLAYVLSGTEKQFEVSWDGAANAISLTFGQSYTAVGGEMTAGAAGTKSAAPTASKVLLDGTEVSLTAYNIGGNNYFKLRDIGQLFDFGVGWDNATKTITIDTSTGYTA